MQKFALAQIQKGEKTMKRIIMLLLVYILVMSGCNGDGSNGGGTERNTVADSPQGETFIRQRFLVIYWLPEWGEGNGKPKYYLTIEVNKEIFNTFRVGEIAPTEALIDSELEPYVPDEKEYMYVIHAPKPQ